MYQTDGLMGIVLQVGRIPPTFLDASKIAIEVLNSGFDFTHGKIVYNKFRTVVSYNLSEIPIFSLKSVEVSFQSMGRVSESTN